MRVAILAGGFGSRLSEETDVVPKPMVDIGGRPILWHILKGFSAAGLSHFVIALGYKGDDIKSFFLDHRRLASHLTIQTMSDTVMTNEEVDDWTVDLVDTGLDTMTGGRVARLAPWLPEDDFCLTYGDGVSNIDVAKLVAFHRAHGRLATVTAVRPPARFGGLVLTGDRVSEFTEKPQTGEGWINGGFMVMRRDVLDRIPGDSTVLETDVLEQLAEEGELMAYRHDDFWQCMDTLRDLRMLRQLWDEGTAPWRLWS